MARKCEISGKAVLVGNNVSHANNKTKTRFLPNLRETSFYSDTLGQKISMRVTANAIRTIEKTGGIDAYVASKAKTKLPKKLWGLKKRLTEVAAAA